MIRAKLKFKGKEKLNEFIQERLINRKVGFLNKKNNFKTGIKLEKKSKNCFNINISLNLEEAFPFSITTVPLSIAIPDKKLRQSGSGKTSF